MTIAQIIGVSSLAFICGWLFHRWLIGKLLEWGERGLDDGNLISDDQLNQLRHSLGRKEIVTIYRMMREKHESMP